MGAGSADALVRQITKQREDGIFLSVLGFGMGNYKDSRMQQLADNGNGNHYYIDNLSEARKVLVNEFGGTLFTIAKDVKIQLEFNPAKVASYRLIGYENRMLRSEDFNDDKKDAGELGSGHTVTALYEIIPVGVKDTFTKSTDPLRYQPKQNKVLSNTNELFFVKLRYKPANANESRLVTVQVDDTNTNFDAVSDNFRFSAAVASFGMILRNSNFKQHSNLEQVLQLARSSIGNEPHGYRKEFCQLVLSVEKIARR